MERILIVADDLSALSPAGEALIIARKLRRFGCLVELVEFRSGKCEAGRDKESVRLYRRNVFDASALARLRDLQRRFCPELIHVFGQNSLAAATLVNLACRRKRIVVTHLQPADSWLASVPNWLSRLGNARADLHLFPSKKAIFDGFTGCKNIFRTPYPLTGDALRQHGRSIIEHEFGIPRNASVVTIVAPHVPRARLKDVIWAADLLTCIRDDVYWLMIGDGPQRRQLERFAGQLQIGDNLRFVGWHENAEAILADSNILVDPSAHFFGCASIRLAIRNGIPVVGTTAEIHRELIEHGRTGYLVETGARNEFARCVNRLVNRPDIAQSMGKCSLERSAGCFPMDISELLSLYRGGDPNSTPKNHAA